MADKKISQLTSATTPLSGSEVLPIVQSGSTVKVPVSSLTAGRAVTVGTLATSTTNSADNVTFESTTNSGIYARWKRPDKTYILSLDINNNGGKNFSVFDETAGATRLDISDAGNVSVSTGNLVLGTAGRGIDFSANGGDILTQYDEGTWAISDISGAGLTLTVDHAKYTRVGNLVTVNVYVTYPVTANASNATLSLPSNLAASKFDIGTAGASNGNVAYAITVGGTNAMTLRGPNLATLTNANLSGADLLISFTYMV
jgi:hypothetical protein